MKRTRSLINRVAGDWAFLLVNSDAQAQHIYSLPDTSTALQLITINHSWSCADQMKTHTQNMDPASRDNHTQEQHSELSGVHTHSGVFWQDLTGTK